MFTSKDRVSLLAAQAQEQGAKVLNGHYDYFRDKGLTVIKDNSLRWGISASASLLPGTTGLAKRMGISPRLWMGEPIKQRQGSYFVGSKDDRREIFYSYQYVISTNLVRDPELLPQIEELLSRKQSVRFNLGTEFHFDRSGRHQTYLFLPGELAGLGKFIEGTPIRRLVEVDTTIRELDFAEAAMRILHP